MRFDSPGSLDSFDSFDSLDSFDSFDSFDVGDQAPRRMIRIQGMRRAEHCVAAYSSREDPPGPLVQVDAQGSLPSVSAAIGIRGAAVR